MHTENQKCSAAVIDSHSKIEKYFDCVAQLGKYVVNKESLIVLISAIITTYRRKPDIVTRALRSVMKQTFSDIEIIVVDDSPIDFEEREAVWKGVLDTCKTAILLSTGGCKGAPAARNIGIKEATGEYIAFLDDDDEWMPEKIEKQLEGFTSDEMGMVYSGIIINDEIDDASYVRDVKHYSGKIHDLLLSKSNFIGSTSGPLIRKTCLENIGGFDESLESGQDYDLYIRLAKLYDVQFVSGEYTIYHRHTGERLSTNVLAKYHGRRRLIEKYSEDLERNPHAWISHYRSLILCYSKMGNKKDALWIWVCTVRKNPCDVLRNMKYFLFALVSEKSILIQGYNRIKKSIRKSKNLLKR